MANRRLIVNQILQGARRRGLDPQAVLAVARVEGLGGGVGDQGTSFGPFQLHAGGALPRGIGNPRAWAESQAGINYALDRIASVASGRRGRDAVAAIVSRFERPANIPGEIARASALYGGPLPAMQPSLPGRVRAPGAPGVTGAPGLSPAILSVINAGNTMFGLNPLPLVAQVPQIRRPKQMQAPGAQTAKTPRRSGRTIKFLEHFAAPYGVQVTSTTEGSHVKGSYHYKGRAVDFGGNPANMAHLMQAALTHPQDFAEAFYSGPGNPGAYIKDGRVYPISQLDRSVYEHHKNHVHLAR